MSLYRLLSKYILKSDPSFIDSFKKVLCVSYHMVTMGDQTQISEGLATVNSTGKVFYNPVQEFNRDLRYFIQNHPILVISNL